MSTPLAQVVEVGTLLEALWTSAVFGLAVLLIAGVGVSASLRAADQRAEHHEGAVVSWSVVTVACVALLAVAVAFGIWAMTQ